MDKIERGKSLRPGGDWVDGVNIIDHVYRENGWLGYPLVNTGDHLEPQTIGSPEGSIDLDSFPETNNTSRVEMVQKITITENVYRAGLQVLAPEWDLDSVSRVLFDNVTNPAKSFVIDNPILNSGSPTTLAVGTEILLSGTQLNISFEFYNTTAANAIDGGWSSNLGTGVPLDKAFNIDNLTTPTVVEIDHDDLDSVDRSTELDGVVSGSIIRITETQDVTRNIEFEVDTVDTASATSTKYTVLAGSINNGSKAIRSGQTCTVHIDVPISQPTKYGVKTGYYPTGNPSWGTITTELYYDGVLQAGAVDGYPINLVCQKAFISSDWFYMASSSTSISGDAADFSDGGEAGGADRTLGNTDNFDLGLKTNDLTRIHIKNDGKVGFGTDTPQSQIDVTIDGSTSASAIRIHDSNDNDERRITMRISSGNGLIELRDTDDVETVQIFANGDSYFNGGMLGIGNISPNEALDVTGNIKVSGKFIGLVEGAGGMIEAPTDKTYILDQSAAYPYDIDTLIAKLASGTLSVAIQIDGTPVTGINTLAVSSTEGTGTASAANSVAIGQTVTMVVTSGSSPVDYSYTLKSTRT